VRRSRIAVTGLPLALVLAAAGGPVRAQDGVQFKDPLNNEPLQIELPADASEAVETFHETGENPYQGNEQALAEGKQVYNRWCRACHLDDGSGRIGPSLVDDTWKYERTDTPVGRFEIIYAGGAGAMQAFGDRLSPDEILQVMAHLDLLHDQAQQ
jgi:cytochrome c-L